MASGAWVPSARSAGLERVARSAGEAFGYEDAAVLPSLRRPVSRSMRWAVFLCGLALVAVIAAML